MIKAKHPCVKPALKWLTLCLLIYFAVAPSTSFAQESQPRDGRYYEQQAIKAYREKSYSAFLENMKLALSLRPNHPRLIYNLAVAHALNGNSGEALAGLARLAAMGLIYPADRDADFDAIKDADEFKKILAGFERNKTPIVKSSSALTVHEKGLVPESIAYDPIGHTFYLSSVYKRKILSIDAHGEVSEFAAEQSGLWSVMGMKVDARRRHLWVTTVAHPQMANYTAEDNGKSAVLKFDLKTKRLLKRYALPNKPAAHWLGDLTLNSRGDVFATDSVSPAIYVIRRRKDEIEPFIVGEPFASPQGLAFSADEKHLFMADYAKGIFVINMQTKESFILSPPADGTLLGIDGLYVYKNSLIGVQNGVNPHRLIRLFLKPGSNEIERLEVVEANHPLYDEPTLGVLVKDNFYYVANSQWGAIDKDGRLAEVDKLREPVVLKVRL